MSTTRRNPDAADIKRAASGREIELLQQLAGIPSELLDGKGHPCPSCHGTDRFSLIDRKAGAVLCRRCFDKGNGDWLAAVCHYRGVTFSEDLKLADEYLGGTAPRPVRQTKPVTKKPKRTWPTGDAALRSLEQWRGVPSYCFTYLAADGTPTGYVLRWDKHDPVYGDRQQDRDKLISQIWRHGDHWRAEALPEGRPLYRLPEVVAADRVLVCEGEKSVDAIWELAVMAVLRLPFAITTSVGGSKAPHKADWQPLAGKRVTIWPDSDNAGAGYANKIIERLKGIRSAGVRMIYPDRLALTAGEDAADFIERRRAVGHDDMNIYQEIISWLL